MCIIIFIEANSKCKQWWCEQAGIIYWALIEEDYLDFCCALLEWNNIAIIK